MEERYVKISTKWTRPVPQKEETIGDDAWVRVVADFFMDRKASSRSFDCLVGFRIYKPTLASSVKWKDFGYFAEDLWSDNVLRPMMPYLSDEDMMLQKDMYGFMWDYLDEFFDNGYRQLYKSSGYNRRELHFPDYPLDSMCMKYSEMYKDFETMQKEVWKEYGSKVNEFIWLRTEED